MQSTKGAEVLKVLSISPTAEDHVSLQYIVGRSTWTLFTADRLHTAVTILRENDISVIICERHLLPGQWNDVLDAINDLPNPPSLIVASRLADDRLWAEALNLGAWDVLAKPFDSTNVLRSVKSAWQHWYDQTRKCNRVMKAAS